MGRGESALRRVLRWTPAVLIVSGGVLVRAGVLDIRVAVWLVASVEALGWILGTHQMLRVLWRYRRGRAGGLDAWAALEDGLCVLLPRRVAHLVALEPRLWVCLFSWLVWWRRRDDNAFSYHRQSMMGIVLLLVVMETPIEMLLAELLVPWRWLRLALLILGVYTLLWVVGLYASLVTLPYRLERGGIWLHYGVLGGDYLPYDQVLRIERERRRAPKGRDGLMVTRQADKACFAIAGYTDVTLWLRAPQALSGVFGPTAPVTAIRLAADEPERLVQALRARLEGAAAVVSTTPGNACPQVTAPGATPLP